MIRLRFVRAGMHPERTWAWEQVEPGISRGVQVPAAGHLGVVEEKCGGAHWPLEYFPERHCGGCGAAL